jgi:transglutaminase-like putative cysteine protease
MIGVFKDIMVNRFWADWDQKFKRTYEMYVNPDHPDVKMEAERLNISKSQTDIEIAHDLWGYIREEYDYNLTKRWRQPQDTIHEGVGDCEDYCFLIASLLPHFGVNRFTIVAGEAVYQEKGEFHVWMQIGDEIIDPTAAKWKVSKLDYQPELIYEIKTEPQ